MALWPMPLASLFTSGVLFCVARPSSHERDWFLAILAFAMLGLVTGTLAGFSREPVVGAVLPAVLSLVGGLAIYLIGAQRADRSLVGLSVIALAFDLFVGATWGAVLRNSDEEYRQGAAYLERRALIDIEVRNFREALGLPLDADAPRPPLVSEPERSGRSGRR
jgi:hypothetical protein